MSSMLLRQDVGPMVVGYALVMGALAIGLRMLRRSVSKPGTESAESRARAISRSRPASRSRARPGPVSRARADLPAVTSMQPGWPRLILHYVGTAVGGYLLLMIILILYYQFVSTFGGDFIASGFSGCGLLLGLSAPVFLALSWLAERTGWRL
jgi:predicted alpha/beta hydrolase